MIWLLHVTKAWAHCAHWLFSRKSDLETNRTVIGLDDLHSATKNFAASCKLGSEHAHSGSWVFALSQAGWGCDDPPANIAFMLMLPSDTSLGARLIHKL